MIYIYMQLFKPYNTPLANCLTGKQKYSELLTLCVTIYVASWTPLYTTQKLTGSGIH